MRTTTIRKNQAQAVTITLAGLQLRCPYADLLPRLTEQEFADLRADIARRGVLVAIVLDEHGNIIDGGHRALIAAELGLRDVPFDFRLGLSPDEKRQLAIDLNEHRRQLTPAQRRQIALVERSNGKSYREIAERLHVDPMTILRDIRKSTVANATVDLPDRIVGKDGKARPARRPSVVAKSASEAARVLHVLEDFTADGCPGRAMDVKRLERIAREHAGHAGDSVRLTRHGQAELRHGDFRKALADVRNAALIFTDPPWGKQYLDLWGDLGKLALRALRPGGLLVTYCGQAYLPQVISDLSQSLQYVWTMAVVGKDKKTVVQVTRVHSGRASSSSIRLSAAAPPLWRR